MDLKRGDTGGGSVGLGKCKGEEEQAGRKHRERHRLRGGPCNMRGGPPDPGVRRGGRGS